MNPYTQLRASEAIQKLFNAHIKRVYAQREEILEAFIAKYGFEPERAVQVEQRMQDGTVRWFVREMTEKEVVARIIMD